MKPDFVGRFSRTAGQVVKKQNLYLPVPARQEDGLTIFTTYTGHTGFNSSVFICTMILLL